MATKARRPWCLVLDWDGTMTKSDTTALIGKGCLDKAKSFDNVSSTSIPHKPWSYFEDSYMQDYSAWKASQSKPESERSTMEDEVAFLSSSRKVEVESFNRVRDALLESQKMQDLAAHPEDLATWMQSQGEQAFREKDPNSIRDAAGLRGLLTDAGEGEDSWVIVSVSWSRNFIIGAARACGLVALGDHDLVQRLWCNELLALRGPAGADDDGLICSANDKRAAFEAALARSRKDRGKPLSIYVGDSTTDLGCLAAADIGICMRDEDLKAEDDRLRKTLARLGVPCDHISKRGHGAEQRPGRLWWVTNFQDIRDHLRAIT